MLILDLPEDLKVYFFGFLHIRDVLNLRLSSRIFKSWLDRKNSVWKCLYAIYFPDKPLEMSIFELSWFTQFKSTWESERKIRWHDHKNGAVYTLDYECASISKYCSSILLLRARVGTSIHSPLLIFRLHIRLSLLASLHQFMPLE